MGPFRGDKDTQNSVDDNYTIINNPNAVAAIIVYNAAEITAVCVGAYDWSRGTNGATTCWIKNDLIYWPPGYVAAILNIYFIDRF